MLVSYATIPLHNRPFSNLPQEPNAYRPQPIHTHHHFQPMQSRARSSTSSASRTRPTKSPPDPPFSAPITSPPASWPWATSSPLSRPSTDVRTRRPSGLRGAR